MIFLDFGDILAHSFAIKNGLLVVSGQQRSKLSSSPLKKSDSLGIFGEQKYSFSNCMDFYSISEDESIVHLTRKEFKKEEDKEITFRIIITKKNVIFCFKSRKVDIFKFKDNCEIEKIESYSEIHREGNYGFFSVEENKGILVTAAEVDGSICLYRDNYF